MEQKNKLIQLTYFTEQAVLQYWDSYLKSEKSENPIKYIISAIQHLLSDPNINKDLPNEINLDNLNKCFELLPKLEEDYLELLTKLEQGKDIKLPELLLKDKELLETFYFLINKTTLKEKKEEKQNKRNPIPLALRLEVFRRDNYTCTICGRTTKDKIYLEADHKTPVSLGGTDTLDNLTTKCNQCNLGKSDRITD